MAEFSKMKLFLYALSFIGFAWNGHSEGLFSNLKDAVFTAQHVFKDILGNFITVARKVKDVHDVLNAAVEENCQFRCPGGGKTSPNKYHKPQSNGCGSLGLEISSDALPIGRMTKCCDEHDICYDTCGSDKENCDFKFKRCLYSFCEEAERKLGENVVKACKTAAKMLFTGTITLGCKSYLDCQSKACFCSPAKHKGRGGKGEL